MRIKAYRTTTPFDNRGDGALSPPTQKSVMPFNNVTTITDILNGTPYAPDIHARGDWAPGEDVDKSYREDGDDYKREVKDAEILSKMQSDIALLEQPSKWKVRVPGGYRMFVSLESVQRYIRDNHIPFRYVTRMAQVANMSSIDRVSLVADSLSKCFMVDSINPKEGVKETGSAFCVAPNLFITCAHVVKKYDKTQAGNDKAFASDIIVNMSHEGSLHRASVVGVNLQWDIALLRSDINVEPFVLETNINVGESIVAIGSPHGFENNVTDGIVSSVDRSIFSYDNAPEYFFVDLMVFPGNSGGPVIQESTGRVVGMVSLIISANDSGYGLNAGLPSHYIEEFMSQYI